MTQKFFITVLLTLVTRVAFSQDTPAPTVYPKIIGYASFLHPIVAFDKNGHTFNFKDSYTVAFPMGINIIKSDHIGFSFEVAPFIRSENDTARVSFILFHPGVIFRLKHDFAFTTRLAFETSGRFGFTPVISKVLVKTKVVNYFTAIGAPVRTGNGRPTTLGFALQLGITF